ncbi:MAG: YceI family protein [Cellvibrio sp.]|uniref:YceI family protein n=1 Tax=Cellvibrio sp. TaxID=1965322 RepID=UPI0031A453AF
MLHHLIKIVMFIVIGVCLSSCGSLIKPNVKTGIVQLEKGSYKLDQAHVAVLFKINHMGLSTFVGRFNKVDASLEFDPANIAAAKLSAVIDMASIDANNPDLEETLRGSSWLDADKYPQAFFKTTSVSVIDQNSAVFTGELTLHGVTAPVDLTVTFNGGANNMLTGFYTLGFSATTTFSRSAFGIDYLVPAIGDQIAIEVFAEFQQQ